MKKVFFFLLLLFFTKITGAQQPINSSEKKEQVNTVMEQQLENISENNTDGEIEDDSYKIGLKEYENHPININTANEAMLQRLQLLSPMQVQSLIRYRELLGELVSIYELQAIPLWDVATINRILPYISVSSGRSAFTSFKKRFRGGDHSVLLRAAQVLEKSEGYTRDPSAGKAYYQGSPQKIFVRYRYNYKNVLQYGFLGEKDAGEQFFKGAQKQGFDFYSGHFFAKDKGIISSLALGDFSVNMGQGLVQWMSLAFKKGPGILSINREGEVLRPYHSAGESNFHRGIGITLSNKRWEATAFASIRKLDANFAAGDSAHADDDHVTSLQTSGYHRTASESADKGIQRQLAFGGNLTYRFRSLCLGVNAVQYRFKYPLVKAAKPYNAYAYHGSSFNNYSLDYSYTYRNVHLFGEAAMNEKNYRAVVAGMLISTASCVDMSIVYRNISKGYQSLYSNAFTDNSTPVNEKGLFTGITLKLSEIWRLDAYADLYKFPWLKFRVNAPSAGTDHFAQLTYKPNRSLEIYTRYHWELKPINDALSMHTLTPVILPTKQDWRLQFSCKLNSTFSIRSRMEASWLKNQDNLPETGFLINADVIYKPLMKPLSANIRLQYFETDSYDSRLYAFENDVLYSFSIPVFYGKGYRYYLNINYDLTRNLSVWGRIAQYLYTGNRSVVSGPDKIPGNHKTEVKLQVLYNF